MRVEGAPPASWATWKPPDAHLLALALGFKNHSCVRLVFLKTPVEVKEDFEIIWKSFVEDSLLYDTYPSARRSGQQPEDISHGSSRIWVMDETSISQSRLEMERQVITQGGFSKMYNQYLLPNRKRAWAGGNDEKFMQDNSLYVAKLSTLKLYFVMLKNVKETV
ncbi:hypothetical protein VPH35_014842 [Triticum aestivum]